MIIIGITYVSIKFNISKFVIDNHVLGDNFSDCGNESNANSTILALYQDLQSQMMPEEVSGCV